MQEEDWDLVGRKGQLCSLQLGLELLDAEPERKIVPGSGQHWASPEQNKSIAFPCYWEMGNAALGFGTAEEQLLALQIP